MSEVFSPADNCVCVWSKIKSRYFSSQCSDHFLLHGFTLSLNTHTHTLNTFVKLKQWFISDCIVVESLTSYLEDECVMDDQLSGQIHQVFVHGQLLKQHGDKHHCQVLRCHLIHPTVALHTAHTHTHRVSGNTNWTKWIGWRQTDRCVGCGVTCRGDWTGRTVRLCCQEGGLWPAFDSPAVF